MKTPNHSEIFPKYISPFAIIILFVLLGLLGLFVTPLLKYRLYPSKSGQKVYITFNYFGAPADVVEMDATSPIEGLLSTLPGVENVSSISGDGWGQITLSISKDVNIQKNRFSILTTIRDIYPKLPQGVTYPTINSYAANDERTVQLLVYTVTGKIDAPELKSIVNELIIPKLSMIDGVKSVNVYGANSNNWYIEYKTDLLKQLGLTPYDIVNAISRQDYEKSIGIEQTISGLSIPVSLIGNNKSNTNWDSIKVAKTNDKIITLGQLATISLRERDPSGHFRINGLNAINIVVFSTEEANQVKTANRIYSQLESVRQSLPSTFSLIKSFDSTDQLRADLRRSFFRTIFSLIILLLFVLLVSRSFKYLLVITISLFLNMAIAMLLYRLLKLEIHLYSLSGITLSLGLIIDNTLVMVDHLRHRRNFLVFIALLAATLTTIGALTSIFFLEEIQRKSLTDFAWVIIINLIISLLIALLFVPSIMQQINLDYNIKRRSSKVLRFKVKISNHHIYFVNKLKQFRIIMLLMGVLLIGIPLFLLPERVIGDSALARTYNNTIGSSLYQTRIKPITDVAFGGTLRLFYISIWEKNFWDIPQRTCVHIDFNLPQGGTIEHANNLACILESNIISCSQVEQTITLIRDRKCKIEVYFHPEVENSYFPIELKVKMEHLAMTHAEADFYIYGVGIGFSNSTSQGWVNSLITLKGYNHQQLMSLARIFADSLAKIPRVDNVWIRGGESYIFEDDYRRFLRLDEDKLLSNGISLKNYTAELLQNAPTYDITQWLNVNDQDMLVRIRPQGGVISDFMLNQRPIMVGSSQTKNENVGRITKEHISDQIYKSDQQYLITLAYNYNGPEKLVEKVLSEHVVKINKQLPFGFTATQLYANSWNDSKKDHYLVIAIMLLVIFFITSILFESVIKPFAVIALIPLSFVGVFVTYWIFDLSFDQGTLASFLLLGGLVVNSAIYIINEQNNLSLKYPNSSSLNIYKRAFNAKIIPIVLTIISSVLGLIPFILFGKEIFWFSIAASTIGGLLFSLPALIIFLPLLPGVIGTESRLKNKYSIENNTKS